MYKFQLSHYFARKGFHKYDELIEKAVFYSTFAN